MHDPDVVLFSFRRPWPRRVAGRRYWPAWMMVWHREPGGRDSGAVCGHLPTGTGWSWRNVGFAIRHWRHLRPQVQPIQRVWHWVFDHCADCGHRFLWKQERMGYMSSDAVYHGPCMTLRHIRSQLDDLTAAVQFTADDTQRWWVEYRLKNLESSGA